MLLYGSINNQPCTIQLVKVKLKSKVQKDFATIKNIKRKFMKLLLNQCAIL